MESAEYDMKIDWLVDYLGEERVSQNSTDFSTPATDTKWFEIIKWCYKKLAGKNSDSNM